MPCNVQDNNLNPGYIPGLPIPGFGIPIAPIQNPLAGFGYPDGFPADLLDLINSLSIQWPGGQLIPQVDNTANTLLKYLANLFSQIAPFLSLYNLFMALLNMVQCVIDVMCAIPNPWKMARAFRRLIKRCLPPFLSLFPATALLAMIISLLLLLLALIEYLIARILQIIEDMILNFELLIKGTTLKDAESTKAVAFKIASLLCIIENLLAIFSSLGAIFAIINSLAQISSPRMCSKTSGSDCCSDDVCPDFISDNPDGINSTTGKLIYYKQINSVNEINDFTRNETWQFVDTNNDSIYKFKDITTSYEDGSDFWPEDRSFSTDSQKKKIPYTLDMKLKNVDVSQLNLILSVTEDQQVVTVGNRLAVSVVNQIHSVSSVLDSDGNNIYSTGMNDGYFSGNDIYLPTDTSVNERDNVKVIYTTSTSQSSTKIMDVVFKGVIVTVRPYIGVRNQLNNLSHENQNGTLLLTGGLGYDIDGNKIYIDGKHTTLTNFIHKNDSTSGMEPTSDDRLEYIAEYTWYINQEALMYYNLITLGCLSQIKQEVDIVNNTFDFDAIFVRNPGLVDILDPNIAIKQTVDCSRAAISKLRKDITIDNINEFKINIVNCLESLKEQTTSSLCEAIQSSVDLFNTDGELSTSIQFVSRPIQANIQLKDKNNNLISYKIPEECTNSIAENLIGEVSLGEISGFVFDEFSSSYVAQINSDIDGDGELRVKWQGNYLSSINDREDIDIDTSISERVWNYTFVGSGANAAIGRDETDVANSGAI